MKLNFLQFNSIHLNTKYPISFNEFFKAGFPVMILTTFIVSIYMLVYVVGADGGEFWVKVILIGITIISIILAVSRGKSKGQTIAETLGDSGLEDAVESVKDIVEKVKGTAIDSEE